MSLTRTQVVLIVLVVVVAGGTALAIWYVEGLYKERERQEELIREGRAEELSGKPPPRPPGPPPLDRPTTRGTEVLVVRSQRPATQDRPAEWRKTVVVRGNGEFIRMPVAGEPGPLVTGLLDRPQVDDLLMFLTGGLSATDRGSDHQTQVVLAAGQRHGNGLSRAGAKRFLELAGKSMNRSAVPERLWLVTVSVNGDAVEPWPFPRSAPDKFLAPGFLAPEGDRAKTREGVLRLLDPTATFTHAGKLWKVFGIDLIP